MASLKCNAVKAISGVPAVSGRPSRSPSGERQKPANGRFKAIPGGIGVVDPDGDNRVTPGEASNAGKYYELKRPTSRPVKQDGLCGQPPSGYYSVKKGKSFKPIMSSAEYTSYEVIPTRQIPLHVMETRVEQGFKLRALYRSLGWSRADCAKFLHITERCLRNWEAGHHPIPPTALKLMRLHLRCELPGKDWDGWYIAAGKLWTPEGHGLNPHDAKWWSMLHRRAETGWKALGRLHALGRGASDGQTAAGSACASADGGPVIGTAPAKRGWREAPRLDLSLEHFRTERIDFSQTCGFSAITFTLGGAHGWR